MVHGSALFQLGETQSLATATVGSPDDEQRMQGMLDADNRRLIVHFTFPPYELNNVSLLAGPLSAESCAGDKFYETINRETLPTESPVWLWWRDVQLSGIHTAAAGWARPRQQQSPRGRQQ